MKSTFAEMLSRLRREKGLSQRRAAADLDISQALLSHYENGAREPKLEFVTRACDYYGVTADYILGRIGELSPRSLPAPRGCESAPRLISVACSVFDTLEGLSDQELYTAAVDFLLVPIETVSILLHDPGTEYDPVRDAEFKMAEAALVSNARRIHHARSE